MTTEEKHPSRTKRLALRIFGHHGVVLPVIGAGVAAAASMVAAPAWMLFTSAMLGATAIGVGTYRLLFRSGVIAEDIALEEQAEREAELARYAAEERDAQAQAAEDLLALRRRLALDDDERDEQLFDRLCQVNGGFSQDHGWYRALNAGVRERVRETFQVLFDDAIARLRSSVELRDQAASLESAALEPLREAREKLLAEVGQIVEQMAKVLAGIQSLGIRTIADQALSHGDARAQLIELETILDGAQAAHDHLSGPARDRRHEAFRQRLRTAQGAEESDPEPEAAEGADDAERA